MADSKKIRSSTNVTFTGNYTQDMWECIQVINLLRRKLRNAMPAEVSAGSLEHMLLNVYEKGYKQALAEGGHLPQEMSRTVRAKIVRTVIDDALYRGIEKVEKFERFVESIELIDTESVETALRKQALKLNLAEPFEEAEDDGRPKPKRKRQRTSDS